MDNWSDILIDFFISIDLPSFFDAYLYWRDIYEN